MIYYCFLSLSTLPCLSCQFLQFALSAECTFTEVQCSQFRILTSLHLQVLFSDVNAYEVTDWFLLNKFVFGLVLCPTFSDSIDIADLAHCVVGGPWYQWEALLLPWVRFVTMKISDLPSKALTAWTYLAPTLLYAIWMFANSASRWVLVTIEFWQS
jgi:hypothetical protein